MNKISTGHGALDVLLCLLVPIIIKHLAPFVRRHLPKLFRRSANPDVYTRDIQHVTK
jgi:hypothetical protein